MDRSYLSDSRVVEASRDFVCVRLLTYESSEEAEFLKKIFTGRSGALENSVFCLLAPDGETKLSRGGRSPDMVFGRGSEKQRVEAMATEMERIAKLYEEKKSPSGIPYLADLRRGLNAASCDLQPLVVVAAKSDEERKKLEAEVRTLAWSKDFIGKFAYASVGKLEELAEACALESPKSGIYIVEPNAYGLKGKVLASTESAEAKPLKKAFTDALAAFEPTKKDSKKHIRNAEKEGAHWEPEIPVTDPHGRTGRAGPRD